MSTPAELPLKDIHLPPEPSWWPPAPGWWLLLVLLMGLAWGAGCWYRRRQQAKLSAAHLAGESLLALREQYKAEHDAKATVQALSVLLRRLSISTFPRVDAAGLTGEAWLQFLDKGMTGERFTQGAGRILIEAPYRQQVEGEELGTLFDLCEAWIAAQKQRRAE